MDEDICRLIGEGRKREAFDLLLPRYQDKVYRLAISILRDRARAEDLAQDVFVKLWQVLPAFNGAASLSTWIYTITRNACLSEVRRQSYRAAGPLEDYAGATAPAHAALDIHKLLARLPQASARILRLFYLEEKSYEEVAAMFGLPIGTVKSQLHRARNKLAEIIQGGR